MYFNRLISIGLIATVIGLVPASHAADMANPEMVPEPARAEKGIWGAMPTRRQIINTVSFGARINGMKRKRSLSNIARTQRERTARL
jgi:hypothetical protein